MQIRIPALITGCATIMLWLISDGSVFADTTAKACSLDDFTSRAYVTIQKTASKAVAGPDTICVPPFAVVTFDVINGKDFKADFNGTTPFAHLNKFNKHDWGDFITAVCEDGTLGKPKSSNYDDSLGGCHFRYKISHIDNEGKETTGDPHVIVQSGGGGPPAQRRKTNDILVELLQLFQSQRRP
jgi:hypothetical protein